MVVEREKKERKGKRKNKKGETTKEIIKLRHYKRWIEREKEKGKRRKKGEARKRKRKKKS